MDIEQFKRERNEALLSLDVAKIRAYLLKWNGDTGPADEGVFMAGIHKAITGCKDLPPEHRRSSKAWLVERGLQSLDDGDL